MSGKDVAINWYKTKRNYDFNKNPNVLHAHAGSLSCLIYEIFSFFVVKQSIFLRWKLAKVIAQHTSNDSITGNGREMFTIELRYKLKSWLATLLEGVNNKIFKVNFKKYISKDTLCTTHPISTAILRFRIQIYT